MTLLFDFKHFGTFAGPQNITGTYDYDLSSIEGTWHTLLPNDFGAFTNFDLGAYLFNNRFDYVGFHCDYIATASMTLQASYGNIPNLNILSSNTNVTGNINCVGNINVAGSINHVGLFTLLGIGDVASRINSNTAAIATKKSFDISHPTKEDHRLRYICLEGPDAEVYIRGKLKDNNTIELPEYWRELVDIDSIGVTLTPIGSYQELFVESIQWGTRIKIKNNSAGSINCSYVVYGTRKDVDRNIPEYEGKSTADYPGNNSEYVINGGK